MTAVIPARSLMVWLLVTAFVLVPAGASAHGPLGTGELAVVFEVVDTLEQHCVKATLFVTIATVVSEWTESWSFRNRYNPLPDAPVQTETGGDGHGPHGVFLADAHRHVVYDRCFAGGAHGDLTVNARIVGEVGGVVVDDHSIEARCHWGHGPACV